MTAAVLLDFDGTLVRFDREAAMHHAFATVGIDVPSIEIRRAAERDLERARRGDHDRRRMFEGMSPGRGAAIDAAFWDAIVALAEPIAGAEALLDHCATRGIATALITDWDGTPGRKRSRIDACPLTANFGAIVIGGEDGVSLKPDPSPFVTALDRLGVTAADVIMVGDKIEADLEPAAALGMRAIWRRADYGGSWTPAVETLDEVIEWL